MSGSADANISFADLCGLVQSTGFTQKETKRHTNQYFREGIPDLINLQPAKDGKAKPYQVRQVRRLFKNYSL
ncbi:MAG: hypothetical protein QOF24_2339 [Verrucomicrobiota bacterium]|jgi:hypothetical protein